MTAEKYDVIIIGLNAVTAYAILLFHANVDSVLVLTQLSEEMIDPYGVCILEYLYLVPLGLNKENITIVKPKLIEISPKVEVIRTSIDRVKIKQTSNKKVVVESGGKEFYTSMAVVSHEVSVTNIGQTILDIEFIEKILNNYGVIKLRDFSNSFKLLEVCLNMWEHGYKCAVDGEARNIISTLAQELSIEAPGLAHVDKTIPELSLRVPFLEPLIIEPGDRVLDLRQSRYDVSEIFLLSILMSYLLEETPVNVPRLRVILSRDYTCYHAGLLKHELSMQIKECSTTKSTLHIPNCYISCRTVYKGAAVLGLSVTGRGSPETRCVCDMLFRTMVSIFYKLKLLMPFLPSTVLLEPKLSPDIVCLRNILREPRVEKLLKPRINHVA